MHSTIILSQFPCRQRCLHKIPFQPALLEHLYQEASRETTECQMFKCMKFSTKKGKNSVLYDAILTISSLQGLCIGTRSKSSPNTQNTAASKGPAKATAVLTCDFS